MNDEHLHLSRQAMREMCIEGLSNLKAGEEHVSVERIARSCRQVCDLVLSRMGAEDAPADESYAAWLLSEKPEGEAA